MADEPGQPPALTTLSLAEKAPASKAVAQVVTPFDVSGGVDESGKLLPVDYDKLVRELERLVYPKNCLSASKE